MNPKVGDVGTAIEITVLTTDSITGQTTPFDLSSATLKNIRFLKPDGTLLIAPAALSTNGTDGKMRYVTVDGDFDQVGTYQVEGEVGNSNGHWTTTIVKMKVTKSI